MELYFKIIDWIAKIVAKFLIALIISLVAIVFANIVLRYMGSSIRWADEMARLLFVWTSFLGMYFAYSRNLHPSFTLIVNKVGTKNPRRGKVMLVFTHVLVLAFLLIVLYGGIIYINLAKIQTTAVLRLSVGWMYAAAPVSMFLMILETLRKFFLLSRADNSQLFLDKDSDLQAGL